MTRAGFFKALVGGMAGTAIARPSTSTVEHIHTEINPLCLVCRAPLYRIKNMVDSDVFSCSNSYCVNGNVAIEVRWQKLPGRKIGRIVWDEVNESWGVSHKARIVR